jgi:hypothetical protein
LLNIVNFLNLDADADLIEKVTAGINSSRAYSYAANQDLQDFYISIQDTPMMKKFGYDNLTS